MLLVKDVVGVLGSEDVRDIIGLLVCNILGPDLSPIRPFRATPGPRCRLSQYVADRGLGEVWG